LRCLLVAFPASLLFMLFCFTYFFFFFSAFLFFAPFYFYYYYSTLSFLQSCVFAVLLPVPLLLCFLILLPIYFLFLYSFLFISYIKP
jgi:hypothetical protein